DEAHEWQFNRQIAQVAETVLTIHLRQDFARVRTDPKFGVPSIKFHQSPAAIRTGPQVEREWNRGAGCLANIATEVETVLRVEAPLIAARGVFVQDVREANRVQHVGRRKAEQHTALRTASDDAVEDDLRHGLLAVS